MADKNGTVRRKKLRPAERTTWKAVKIHEEDHKLLWELADREQISVVSLYLHHLIHDEAVRRGLIDQRKG